MQHFVRGQLATVGLASAFLTGLVMTAHAETSAAISTTPPSVLVLDQTPKDGKVLVEYAYLPNDGYVVLYGADKNGQPIRGPIGHAELKAGSHIKFNVKIDKPPQSGDSMWAALYVDKDNKPGFDKTADASIWNDKLPLENRFVVQ